MEQEDNSPKGWATVVVKRGQKVLWKEDGCWATLGAVLPELNTIVYVGTWYQVYLFARTYEGKFLWKKEVATGAYGASEILAAGRYVLAMGRGFLRPRSPSYDQLWNRLVDCRTGRIVWNHSNEEIGQPFYLDQRTFLSVTHKLIQGHVFIECCDLLTRRLLFRHPFPVEVDYTKIRVRARSGRLHVYVEPAFTRNHHSVLVTMPQVYPVNATVYSDDFDLPGNVRVITL